MAEEVKVRISTETTGTEGIRKADSALQSLKSQATASTSIFRELRNTLAGVFVLDKVAEAGKAILTVGSQMEQAKISFTTFTGSAQKANEVIGDLQQFANVTPFDNEQVIGAGRALLAFGIGTDKLLPSLKAIGDVSAATGKGFNDLATIYGKARTQGTLYAEDINQLTEAGIPIIDEFAKILRRPNSEIKKLASEGQIGFNLLERAFVNMTGKGGRFYNLMKAQSESSAGKASNFFGLLQVGGIRAFNALQPYINQLIDLGTAYLPTAIEHAAGFWHALRDGARWIKANADWLKPLAAGLLGAAAAYGAITLALKAQAAWTAIVTAATWALDAAMTANPIGVVIVAIGAFIGWMVYLYNTNEKVRGTILALWNVTKTVFKGIYDFAKLYLLSVAKIIGGIFSFDPKAIKDGLTGFASGVKDIATGFVKESQKGVAQGFSQAAADMKEKANDAKAGGSTASTFLGKTLDGSSKGKDLLLDPAKKKNKDGTAVGSVSGSRPTSVHLHINKLVGIETLKSDLASLKRGDVPQMTDGLLSNLTRMLADVEQFGL